ncbi:MAG: long-chain fatty acid--CoA ligase, partial [Flavobacteriaceae bacterium]
MTPSRIFDILSFQVETHPLEKCLSDKRNGNWESISTLKYFESVNHVSAALIEMGVKPQDKIALISTT